MIPTAGAFSSKGGSSFPRAKTPQQLKRTGSSSTQNSESKLSRAQLNALHHNQQQQQQQQLVGNNSFNSQSLNPLDADRRSVSRSVVSSVAPSTAATGGAQQRRQSSSHVGFQPRQHFYGGSNKTSRIYLPGEEELVLSRNVVDVSSASADMEILENDLGRSSLMMPKKQRDKMYSMREELMSPGGGGGGGTKTKAAAASSSSSSPPSALHQAMQDAIETMDGSGGGAGDENSSNKSMLPRGSHLLKRLQASVDRSSQLIHETENRAQTCHSLMDQLSHLGVAAAMTPGKKKAALTSAAAAAAAHTPHQQQQHRSPIQLTPSPQPTSNRTPIVLSPSVTPPAGGRRAAGASSQQQQQQFGSPDGSIQLGSPSPQNPSSSSSSAMRGQQHQQHQQHQQQLDDTLKDLSASPPPQRGLDDTFAYLPQQPNRSNNNNNANNNNANNNANNNLQLDDTFAHLEAAGVGSPSDTFAGIQPGSPTLVPL